MNKKTIQLILISLLIVGTTWAQYSPDLSVVQRIKNEGIKHSQVMDILSHLSDVIGPRLAGSPAIRAANKWAAEKMTEFGLENAEIEPWGTFGKGWQLESFHINMIAPQFKPLIAFPKAWVGGTEGRITGQPVLLDIKTEEDIEKYKGKVKGAIVMMGAAEETDFNFDADAERYTEEELEDLAMAPEPGARPSWYSRIAQWRARRALRRAVNDFLKKEKPAVILEQSRGTDGTVFVSSGGSREMNSEPGTPAIVVSSEQYNRIARMLKAETPVTLDIELKTKFFKEDSLGYNVIAEIPGSDLADQVVMLGGHIDSWHAGTGATDDASGCAVAMEAARIIKALDLKPRRTIRVALWDAEEEGLLGSRGYVKKHFGDRRTMELKDEHENLSVYFNFDNGSGKIRGIYLQGNDAARPIFEKWFEPFHDMGASTVSIRNTGGTDHLSFDGVGLPGFQFVQDKLDYNKRTHHTNMDVYDKCSPSDLIQSSIIMASFIYNAAMMDERFPRKELPKPRSGGRFGF